MKFNFFFALLFIITFTAQAQNNRNSNFNQIGWYTNTFNVKLSNKFSIFNEFHWRRDNWIQNWQQSNLKLGLNYQLTEKVQARIGYAWVETFPYGAININSFGKEFTEHRIYETIILSQQEGFADITHRFMLEQRFIGKYASATDTKESTFPITNRFRYQFKMNLPLKGKTIAAKIPYAVFYDEIFIGFGKNVNANVFDQNRIGAMLGYKFNSTIKLEAGYISQIQQLGRLVNSKNVFQYNSGFQINATVNLSLMKKLKYIFTVD
jgi:hypothetical protein